MTNQAQNPKVKKYDLDERTALFGEQIIKFCMSIRETTANKPIISQMIRSATSIGANYMEADCAESGKDFYHKIAISKKESKETTHWLRMLCVSNPELKNDCEKYRQEAHELTLIFSSIIRKKP